MKRVALIVVAIVACAVCGTSGALAQSFSEVEGVWTLKKSRSWGGEVIQTVEFKDNRFLYRETDPAGDTLLVARGAAKVEGMGPFRVLRLTGIEGGTSENWLEPVNEDRSIIYATGWRTLTVALNFDAAHDGEEARVDVYKKQVK